MPTRSRTKSGSPGSLSWVLLCILMVTLWLAGGASRADALGQVVVRIVCTGVMIIAILAVPRPRLARARPVLFFLLAAVALVLLQLVPLPPWLWQSLPGREMLTEAAAASGQEQPWRPLTLVPGATRNAAFSLMVPAAVLLLALGLSAKEWSRVPGFLLGLITAAALLGLLQATGAGIDNPLINEPAGQIGGPFANRNHFALLLALGCLLLPAWTFIEGRRLSWRGPVAFGLLLLFLLTILATGSRVGIVLGALALAVGLALSHRGVRAELRRFPRWVYPALAASLAAIIGVFVLISVAADRAASVNRALTVDPGQDFRARALPTLFEIVRTYFPAGSGFGGFDPVFRMHEPFGLLKLTYFNHAHDDLLEVVLDGGLPAAVLLVLGVLWWARASVRAWRSGPESRHALPKIGSAMLLLVIIASAFDYPARTPLILAMVIFAALWLSTARAREPGGASPNGDGI